MQLYTKHVFFHNILFQLTIQYYFIIGIDANENVRGKKIIRSEKALSKLKQYSYKFYIIKRPLFTQKQV